VIARVWRGWARRETADAYERHYRTEVTDVLAAVPGFVDARLLRRDAGDEVEFVSVTTFDDLDAVRAFAGPEYERAVVADAARRVLARFDPEVTHYDLPVTTRPVTTRPAAGHVPAAIRGGSRGRPWRRGRT
jgi:heme-degrading monooxygenase HmoA